jgi:hypothetical protein
MARGINMEKDARTDYQDTTKYIVSQTGLWVSQDTPVLACSPDGIVDDHSSKGILEIKVLKIFQKRSPKELISEYNKSAADKKSIQSQCFLISGDKLILKETHAYFYQIQHQLLVTGLSWCDFVLCSPKGDISIQRINRNETMIQKIRESCVSFWRSVVAPEIVEMKSPRNLNPFILL